MKFKILSFIIISAAVIGLSSVSYADDINLTVNGASISSPTPPQIIDGRTMVPVRAIFEAVGAEVDFDGSTKTITGEKDNTSVIMQIGSKKLIIKDEVYEEVYEMDTSPVIVDGSTLAPARYVAESFGFEVAWDSDTKTVSIEKEVELSTSLQYETEEYKESTYETSTYEESTEATTIETTETTTEIYVADCNQAMTKQIKSDIKTAMNIYSLGNAESINRFTGVYRNNLYKSWTDLAKNDFDNAYIAKSKSFYENIFILYKALDNAYYNHKDDSAIRELYKEYTKNANTTYLSFANAERFSQLDEAIQSIKDTKNEFDTYIKTKYQN